MSAEATAFEAGEIGPLRLRNRFIKSATFEGMTPGGVPSSKLVEHHAKLSRGGVGMTTVAYGAVLDAGRSFAEQLLLETSRVPKLRELTDAVHEHGAAASIQLTHCGFFTRRRSGAMPKSASWGINRYGLATGVPVAKAMDGADIDEVVQAFAVAARAAKEAGFDAVEIHAGHGYLLSQFISPATNRRSDAYGGDVESRAKLAVEVVRAVVDAVGDELAVLVKTNLEDGFAGGLQIDEAVEVARLLEAAGAHALVPSGGFTSRTPFHLLRGGRPLDAMVRAESNLLMKGSMRVIGSAIIKEYPFEETFFLPLAQRVRSAVKLPLALLGGVVSREGVGRAMSQGFEFIALARALIADPDFVDRLQRGELERSRCTACNECIAEFERGGVRCVLDDAANA